MSEPSLSATAGLLSTNVKSSSYKYKTSASSNSSGKKLEIPTATFRKAQIDWEAFDKLKVFKHHDVTECQLTFQRSSSCSSSGSTDSLIEEANHFLNVAKEKLVTTQDWSVIKSAKKTRVRLS